VPRSAWLKNLGGETFDGEGAGHEFGGNAFGGDDFGGNDFGDMRLHNRRAAVRLVRRRTS
jgi:hypothetical protein